MNKDNFIKFIEETKRFPYFSALYDIDMWNEDYKTIINNIEVLGHIKSKTLLLYSDRKRIAQEYEKWCKDNNVMVSDTTNMITWLLCIKLKGWLENA